MNRVVVTGMAGLCPIGNDWSTIEENLRLGRSGVKYMPDWDFYDGLMTRLAAPVENFTVPEWYTRKKIRSMGRVSLMSVRATELALIDAHLLDDPKIKNGSMGIAYGSSTGSTDAIESFNRLRSQGSLKGITATTYIQMMSHTCAVNVGVFFGLKGRIIPSCSACTSGSLGIGYAYETIKYGQQIMMVAGGAEELCVTEAAVFDVMYATSTRNDQPTTTPRPFDKDRDGLVIGEGACTFILEELSHAQARNAKIYAEIVGFGTNSDGLHITNPCAESMGRAMELSLGDAGLRPEVIGYINAHATATELGDIAESKATRSLFGDKVPISSLKSYMGHTLGASGALEAWLSVNMMNRDWYAPTLNLDTVDTQCAELDYIMGNGRKMENEYVMNNNFAFGGINTSLIFKRWS